MEFLDEVNSDSNTDKVRASSFSLDATTPTINPQLSSSFFVDAHNEEFINPEHSFDTPHSRNVFFSPPSTNVNASSLASQKTPSVVSSKVGYLNSENLARLDANVAAVDPSQYDDCASEESFHSAVSIDQLQLIADVSTAIDKMQSKGQNQSLSELEVLRGQAELRAMLAAKREVEEGETEDVRRQGALRAKALLRSRARRPMPAPLPVFSLDDNAVNTAVLNERFLTQSSSFGDAKQSSKVLRKAQNRETFFFTIKLNEFKCNLSSDENSSATSVSPTRVLVSFSLSSLAVSLRGRSQDLRAKVVLDSFHFGDGDGCHVRSYKCGPSGESLMFPDFEPPLMHDQGDVPFLSVVMEKASRGDKGARLKVDVGGLEASLERRGKKSLRFPRARHLVNYLLYSFYNPLCSHAGLSEFISLTSSMLDEGQTEPTKPPRAQRKPASPTTSSAVKNDVETSAPLAISVKLNSILVKLLNENLTHVFSSNLSNLELRIAKTHQRRQFDFILGGARLVDEIRRYDMFR